MSSGQCELGDITTASRGHILSINTQYLTPSRNHANTLRKKYAQTKIKIEQRYRKVLLKTSLKSFLKSLPIQGAYPYRQTVDTFFVGPCFLPGRYPACNLPKVTGPCRAAFRRWYFNKAKGICERFIYGGCRGNANNFRTKQECEQKCKGRCKSKFTKHSCILPPG